MTLNMHKTRKIKIPTRQGVTVSKGCRSYISQEDEDESFSSSSSLGSNDEFGNLCLITHKKDKGLEVYDSDSDFKSSYNQLSNDLRGIYVNALGAFKNISRQRKLILSLEKDIFDFNSALGSLIEVHASLVSEHVCVLDTLVERGVKMECDTCPTLKNKNENLKGQQVHVVLMYNIFSTFSMDKRKFFKKSSQFSEKRYNECFM